MGSGSLYCSLRFESYYLVISFSFKIPCPYLWRILMRMAAMDVIGSTALFRILTGNLQIIKPNGTWSFASVFGSCALCILTRTITPAARPPTTNCFISPLLNVLLSRISKTKPFLDHMPSNRSRRSPRQFDSSLNTTLLIQYSPILISEPNGARNHPNYYTYTLPLCSRSSNCTYQCD